MRLRVESLAAGGDGVARAEGRAAEGGRAPTVFVPGAIAGDAVDARIERRGGAARAVEWSLVEPSPDRVAPPCPWRRARPACGGCDWMAMRPEAQVAWHARIVAEALRRARVEAPPPRAHTAPRTERYRTRARWHVRAAGGQARVGYREAAGRAIVEPAACIVLDARIEPVMAELRAALAGARGEGEASVALGAGGRPVVDLRFDGALPGSTFAAIDARVRAGAWAGADVRLEGAREPARAGDPRAVTIGGDGLPLVVPSAGFAQASPEASVAIARRAVDLLAPAGADVLELFAGSGNFAVAIARAAASLVLVEADARAAGASRENLASRGLRARVVRGDALAFDPPAAVRAVILDPPRTGARGAVERIARSRARRVVYVSCDPPTLARDVAILAVAGFRATDVETFEMFPHTSHVEAVVRLERERRRT